MQYQWQKYYVYILASKKYGALYVGLTDYIKRRVTEHKEPKYEGHTKEYFIRKLVYFEVFSDAAEAALREKRLKKWKREWKIRLIEKGNPEWRDLYETIV